MPHASEVQTSTTAPCPPALQARLPKTNRSSPNPQGGRRRHRGTQHAPSTDTHDNKPTTPSTFDAQLAILVPTPFCALQPDDWGRLIEGFGTQATPRVKEHSQEGGS